jgi:glycosyltransferase involved in cell wall biosynthesis
MAFEVVELRVLFVTDNYYPYIGGAETLWKNLCERLVQKGHRVAVVTNNSTGQKQWFQIINDVSVTYVNSFSRYSFALQSLKEVWEYAKLCDVIVTTTYTAAFPARIVGFLLNKPVVIVVHEILGSMWGKLQGMNPLQALFHQFMEWCIIQLQFDKYVGVSNSTCNQIKKYGHDAATIYNGIDYEHFSPDKPSIRCAYSDFVYMFYGRPGYSKGLEYLLRAAEDIKDQIPHSKLLLLLGKEPKAQYDKALEIIKGERLYKYVILHDPVPYKDLPSYIKGVDCVVVPSVTEGFGFTTAEACAMGVPVVASFTHSIPEVISGNYRLFTPCNHKAITEAVVGVFNGNYFKGQLYKFTWEDCVNKYDELLRSLVE